MIKLGDIFYVRKGVMSSDYDEMPVIFFNEMEGYYQLRYQKLGELTHSFWNIRKEDFFRYLEKR